MCSVCKIHIIEEVEVMKLEDHQIYPGSIKGVESIQCTHQLVSSSLPGCVSLVHLPLHPGSVGLTGPHPGNCILLKNSSAYHSALYSALMSRAVHCIQKPGYIEIKRLQQMHILCSAYFSAGEMQCSHVAWKSVNCSAKHTMFRSKMQCSRVQFSAVQSGYLASSSCIFIPGQL